MSENENVRDKGNKANFWLMLLILGSLVGLSEVVLSGYLRQVGFAYRSGLLTGIGFGIIAVGLAIYKKPLMAIGIGLIGVLCKQMAVVILHVSVMCKMNSCIGSMSGIAALSILAYLTMSRLNKIGTRILVGGAAALLGAGAFYYIGMRVAPCNYLLSFNRAGGFVDFMVAEGLVWAAFSIVLFPLGWLVGEKVAPKIENIVISKPRLFYAQTALTTVICWALCAIAIANGY